MRRGRPACPGASPRAPLLPRARARPALSEERGLQRRLGGSEPTALVSRACRVLCGHRAGPCLGSRCAVTAVSAPRPRELPPGRRSQRPRLGRRPRDWHRGLKRGPRPGVARATSSRARARPRPPDTGVPHEQRWGMVPVYALGKANCDLAGTLRFPYQDFRTSRDRVAGGVRSASVHGGREPRRGASEPAGWSGTVQDYCLWPRRVPQTSGSWRDFPHGSHSHPPRRAGEDAAGLGSPRPVLTAWPPTTGPACHCLPSLLAASLMCLLGDRALSWRS